MKKKVKRRIMSSFLSIIVALVAANTLINWIYPNWYSTTISILVFIVGIYLIISGKLD